jgi:hypothetical protein
MKCLLQGLAEAQAISLGDAPGAVADSILEAVEPVESLAQGRGTSDCRYEHEPQLRLFARSSPVGRDPQPSEEERWN